MASFASQISFVLLFLLFTTTLNKSAGTSNWVVRCNEKDQRLLLIFKQGVVDPNNQLSSWTVEEDCCSWEGVYCDKINRRVIELSLFNHTLRGEINLCLLQLEFLIHLDLSYNHFKTVSMPSCHISTSPFDAHKFDNQSLTTSFNLSASFSVTLRYLNFSYNYELGINDLHWLSQLSSLKYLDLSGNDIGNETKWLHYIAMLPSLSELHLRFCELRDFPTLDYINLTSLEVLDLLNNFYPMKSKFLPNSFFNITKHIYHLDLSQCDFYGQLPTALLNLQNLKHLDLRYNNLKGSIPNWLGQYEWLQYLDIEHNLFYGVIPSSLGNISSLFYLELFDNQLSGSLPETLGELHKLNHLGIGGNSWVGVLTEKNFSNFSNLLSLSLRSTSFKFEIDPKWVPPFQLEYLNLHNTSIGPNVPTWLYTQQSLRWLRISTSGISKIDTDVFWSFVATIDDVNLSNNLISDNISNVTLSANTVSFLASNNSLSGSIFSLLCQFESNRESMLAVLDLSYNHLSGQLPDCWANWKKVEYLNLGGNKLTGKIPPSLASLMNLHYLDLSNNSLFGRFSLDMLNWTNLEFLLLDQNKFCGSLPNPVAQDLVAIQMRNNQFIGNIPSQLCNLSHLMILDLAENKLSGSIPHCLYNITPPKSVRAWNSDMIKIYTKGRELDYPYYRVILAESGISDLSTNKLSGEIPKELFSFSQMQILNLSRNHLTGKIPKEIGDMKSLESLDLSYNGLHGEIPSAISNLSLLAYLNLSYNNFIGQIPLGTQIQTFESWSFVGNHELCGYPLLKKCNKKKETQDTKLVEGNEDCNFLKSLYLGMGVGFAVGFWGVCGSLFILRAWRHNFFQWFDHLVDQLYVTFALCFKSFD